MIKMKLENYIQIYKLFCALNKKYKSSLSIAKQ